MTARDYRELRGLVVANLLELKAKGVLTRQDIAEKAELLEVSERTLERWIAQERPPTYERGRYEACERDMQAVFDARGRLAAAYRKRLREDPSLPSFSTWKRAVRRVLRPGDLAFARLGERGRRAHTVYLRNDVQHRNEVWEADHQEMKVLVLPNRGVQRLKPWITAFIDCFSRAIVSYVVSFHPGEAEVLAGLYNGIALDPGRGPFGGIPQSIHYDNGREWLANRTTQVYQAVGVLGVAVAPYSPHQKGKIERWFGTLDREFTSQQPYYTRGPRRADNTHYGPGNSCDPISIDLFVAQLDNWIYHYNTERPHRGLGGQTPLQRWNEDDATVLRAPSKEELVWLLPSRDTAVVQNGGIYLDGLAYLSSDLDQLVGQQLEIRYAENDFSTIEVMRDGKWFTTAKLHERFNEADRQRLIAARKEGRRRASLLRTQATRNERRQAEQGSDDRPRTPSPHDGFRITDPDLRTDLLGLDIDEGLD
jgi:putative transposase